jgi:hypothetical protein
VAAAFALLGFAYTRAVPIGEAPDEPAHLGYIDHIVATGGLPPAPSLPDVTNYEAFQPPLDYWLGAAWVRWAEGRPIAYPFEPDPGLDFQRAGSRAFLPAERPEAAGAAAAPLAPLAPLAHHAAAAVRRLRVWRLGWGVLTALCLVEIALLLSGGEAAPALLAAAPFVFAPQLLFVSATVNNDGAVTACAALAVLALLRARGAAVPGPEALPGAALAGSVVPAEAPNPVAPHTPDTLGMPEKPGVLEKQAPGALRSSGANGWCLAAGMASGLAFWGKLSGLSLAPAALYVAVDLVRRRGRRAAAFLVAPPLLLGAAWIALSLWRFHSPWPPAPPAPAALAGASAPRLAAVLARLAEPRWPAALWVSFWGKFGWLNLPLPAALYLGFLPATLLAAFGCLRPASRAAAWPLRLLAAANLALVLAYALFVNWQMQGRYLFPSLGAAVGFAALAVQSLRARWRWLSGAGGDSRMRLLAGVAAGLALAMALAGLVVLQRAYG